MDVYGHLMTDVNQEAAIKLGKSVFGTAGSNMVATKEKGTSQSTLTP